jgi:tetratricopeptide (TPR) repeat protein
MHAEQTRLLLETLSLYRGRGDDYWVGRTLRRLADANRMLELYDEGIIQGKEALEIYERLGDTDEQVWSLLDLARLLFDDDQLDEAEESTTRAIGLLQPHQDFQLCQSHRILGDVSRSRKERAKAVHHYHIALRIATPFDWYDQLFWAHHSLARLFCDLREYSDANTHLRQAKQHVADDVYYLGRAMEMQGRIWHREHRLQEARSETLRAIEVFEKLGAAKDLEHCMDLLQDISNGK